MPNKPTYTLPETLIWSNGLLSNGLLSNGLLRVLDQRKLPHEIVYLDLHSLKDAWTAIQTLAVRGAPAIGVAAAYALAQANTTNSGSDDERLAKLVADGDYLKSARPTAVNLAWAVDRLINAFRKTLQPATLAAEALAIHQEDRGICQQIGKHGAHLIRPNTGVLTHCNAGALATTGIGTATAPMYTQYVAGVSFRVYTDETRPLYQGARLTDWELTQAGINTTLICDNMAATLMSQDAIHLVLVGTDRVTANGDVVNKIGTLNVAILCRHFDIPFYVACPSSTFDQTIPDGKQVAIEQRQNEEVVGHHAKAQQVLNPAFDITPANLVTGIITEHGICKPAEIKNLLGVPQ